MTRKEQRAERLMPAGVPRYVRVYDNGGPETENGTSDRYTVCYTGKAGTIRTKADCTAWCQGRAMSVDPFHPCGIGLTTETKWRHPDVNKHGFAPAMGRTCHLGKRIPFTDLPEPCQRLVVDDYKQLWNL